MATKNVFWSELYAKLYGKLFVLFVFAFAQIWKRFPLFLMDDKFFSSFDFVRCYWTGCLNWIEQLEKLILKFRWLILIFERTFVLMKRKIKVGDSFLLESDLKFVTSWSNSSNLRGYLEGHVLFQFPPTKDCWFTIENNIVVVSPNRQDFLFCGNKNKTKDVSCRFFYFFRSVFDESSKNFFALSHCKTHCESVNRYFDSSWMCRFSSTNFAALLQSKPPWAPGEESKCCELKPFVILHILDELLLKQAKALIDFDSWILDLGDLMTFRCCFLSNWIRCCSILCCFLRWVVRPR